VFRLIAITRAADVSILHILFTQNHISRSTGLMDDVTFNTRRIHGPNGRHDMRPSAITE